MSVCWSRLSLSLCAFSTAALSPRLSFPHFLFISCRYLSLATPPSLLAFCSLDVEIDDMALDLKMHTDKLAAYFKEVGAKVIKVLWCQLWCEYVHD